jgi:hypothetical protein
VQSPSAPQHDEAPHPEPKPPDESKKKEPPASHSNPEKERKTGIFTKVTSLMSLVLLLLIIAGLLFARSKALTVLDSIDKELYTIQETTLRGTLVVTKGVTVGTVLPVGEVIQKMSGLPDEIPIDTKATLNTQSELDTILNLDTSIPIETTSTSTLEGLDLGLETITIPIETTAPLKTTVPLNTTLPINTTLPLKFSIPISEEIDVGLDRDLDLETTIPVDAEIPMELDISDSNFNDRIDSWHDIINTIRKILLSPEKSRDNFDIEMTDLTTEP